jgi:CheY-like chemotaxis protein
MQQVPAAEEPSDSGPELTQDWRMNALARSGILVVEDDADIRESLRETLEDAGYRVTTARHGLEGLERLSHIDRPALILLDLMMPVMSGPEFLEALHEDERIADIPVLIVSAYAEVADNTTGCVGFIPKPVPLDRLLDSVRRYSRAS